MSTLPKSIQTQMGASNEDHDHPENKVISRDRVQGYREFINKYKQLPDDFLRIPPSLLSQDSSTLNQSGPLITRETPLVDMIDISVVEAQLVKNYGLLRMDLYCKIRVGHMVCETQTCLNGAKNPKWDGVYQFTLKPGIDSFHIEIYDEKQFSLDEKIAWLYEPIPPEVFQGITVERWFPLSGRLGPNKEGSILLVVSHKRVPMRSSSIGRAIGTHHTHQGPPLTVFVPAVNQGGSILTGPISNPTYVQPGLPPQMSPPLYETQPIPEANVTTTTASRIIVRDEDVNQLSEMFPSIEKSIIKAVLENNGNDKEASIAALLALG